MKAPLSGLQRPDAGGHQLFLCKVLSWFEIALQRRGVGCSHVLPWLPRPPAHIALFWGLLFFDKCDRYSRSFLMVFGGLDSTAVAPKSADGNLIYTTGGTCRIQMNLIGGRSRSKKIIELLGKSVRGSPEKCSATIYIYIQKVYRIYTYIYIHIIHIYIYIYTLCIYIIYIYTYTYTIYI